MIHPQFKGNEFASTKNSIVENYSATTGMGLMVKKAINLSHLHIFVSAESHPKDAWRSFMSSTSILVQIHQREINPKLREALEQNSPKIIL